MGSRDQPTPAATVVVPLLGQPDAWLERGVRSVLEQTVEVQAIVVRSAKTPESNRIVLDDLQREVENLTVVEEERQSFPGAINQGIRLARAPRVGLLLADDWLDATTVEKCLRFDADIVCTGIAGYQSDGVTRAPRAEHVITEREFRRQKTLEAKARYLCHFFLFRRTKLFEVGLLDETIGDYPGIDDYHLIWSLLEADASVRIVEERLCMKRDHDGRD